MTEVIESFREQDTYELGKRIGQGCKCGMIFALNGDLGAGKTVFTKGFGDGIGVTEPLNSPTFTIMKCYEGRMPLYHFDVYRISDPEEMEEIGYDEYFYGDGVCLVEWAELIDDLIPKGAIWIKIETDINKGFNYRRITIDRGV